ncbi:MAG: HAD family hydrolase [Candidatus Omnitrophica bacterium]|jgi:histidinol-phosphate phosphatase family protein|nr:HAD family hydrolase [Candidatus Omnitrophota bacterium]
MKIKAVFLDRDGVINQYPGDFKYVTSPEEFHLLPGAGQAINKLNAAGFKVFVVSNQAGVGKGIYSQGTLDAITCGMEELLKKDGAVIDQVYYCTHTNEANCNCRKPKNGLVHMAVARMANYGKQLDLSKSYFVGDTIRDIETGKSSGVKTILVFSGKEKQDNKPNWHIQPDFTALDLPKAVEIILKEGAK